MTWRYAEQHCIPPFLLHTVRVPINIEGIMADLIDYTYWRGDIPFSAVPFNGIDALVLCQLTYLDYSTIVSSDFNDARLVSDVVSAFKKAPDYKKRADPGLLINKKTSLLLEKAGSTKRFGSLQIYGYANIIDEEREEQFSALTYIYNDTATVVFRGTDDTLVGWKEDFNMAFMDEIPSQQDALEYLTELCSIFPGTIRICGHSKGGNLAVFGASMLSDNFRERITDIYDFDGPGLNEKVLNSTQYRSMLPKLHSYYPQFSIIGMLFDHPEKYTVVESEQSGIMQHDPFSWHTAPTGFITLPELEDGSRFIDKTVNGWFLSLKKEEREQFISFVFSLIQATEARTNSELAANWLKNSAAVIKAMTEQNPKTRDSAMRVLHLLFKRGAANFPDMKTLLQAKPNKK